MKKIMTLIGLILICSTDMFASVSPPSNVASTTTPAYIPPPTVSITASPTIGAIPFNVNFTSAVSGVVTSFSWSFGDGNIVNSTTATNLSHIYTTPGVYSVFLVVFSTSGINTGNLTGFIVATNPIVIAPPTPSNLVVTAVSSNQVNISWINPNTNNLVGFLLFRNVGATNNPFSLIVSNISLTTSYKDLTVQPSTQYNYYIQNFNNN